MIEAGGHFLVTGGAGFVGSNLVDALLARGAARVTVVDNLVRGSIENLKRARNDPRFEFVNGDVRDSGLMDDLIRDADVVFHEAALRITACASMPREGHEVMMDGSFNVLESCARHRVRRLVAASSASVYGQPDRLPIDEDHPFNNRTLYGAAKIALEQYLRSFAEMYGLEYIALRYFNLYGPRMDMTGAYTEVLVRWMDRIDAGSPPIIFGTGGQTMDFVYVSDAVLANLAALRPDLESDVFNVATGVETSLRDLASSLLRIMGAASLEPEYEAARQIGPVGRRRGGTQKARELLGFEPQVSLEEGLRSLVRWRRERAEVVDELGSL